MLGREVVERGQLRPVAVELRDRLGVLGAVLLPEDFSAARASLWVGAPRGSLQIRRARIVVCRSPAERPCAPSILLPGWPRVRLHSGRAHHRSVTSRRRRRRAKLLRSPVARVRGLRGGPKPVRTALSPTSRPSHCGVGDVSASARLHVCLPSRTPSPARSCTSTIRWTQASSSEEHRLWRQATVCLRLRAGASRDGGRRRAAGGSARTGPIRLLRCPAAPPRDDAVRAIAFLACSGYPPMGLMGPRGCAGFLLAPRAAMSANQLSGMGLTAMSPAPESLTRAAGVSRGRLIGHGAELARLAVRGSV